MENNNVIHWSKLTAVQRDELVARTVFGWQPVMCAIDFDEGVADRRIQEDDYGNAYCLVCGGHGVTYSDDDVQAFAHVEIPPAIHWI